MLRIILPAVVLIASGCSGEPKSLPMATTAEKSRPALETVLNGWKAGKTADELKSMTPPHYFIDGDFTKGGKLSEYKIDGEGKPYGTGYRYDVTLTVGGKNKSVAYRVVTEPNTSISREDD